MDNTPAMAPPNEIQIPKSTINWRGPQNLLIGIFELLRQAGKMDFNTSKSYSSEIDHLVDFITANFTYTKNDVISPITSNTVRVTLSSLTSCANHLNSNMAKNHRYKRKTLELLQASFFNDFEKLLNEYNQLKYDLEQTELNRKRHPQLRHQN